MKLKNLRCPLALLAAMASASAHAGADYNGVYAGLTLGYVSGKDTGNETPPNPTEGTYTQQTEPSGGLLAASVGYAHLFAGRYVLGLEADAELRNPSEHSVQKLNGVPTSFATSGFVDPIRFSSNIAFNVGPRLGFVLNDGKTLLSATTGATVARITRSFGCVGAGCGFQPGDVTSITQTDWQAGWSAGAGIEHFVSGQLTAGIDYRHSGFGQQDVDYPLFNPIARQHQKYSEDSVRFTLRYRF